MALTQMKLYVTKLNFLQKKCIPKWKKKTSNGQKIDIFEFIEKFGHVVFDLTF